MSSSPINPESHYNSSSYYKEDSNPKKGSQSLDCPKNCKENRNQCHLSPCKYGFQI